MTRGLNKAEIVGNIGSVEFKYLSDGTAVLNLSVAVNERYGRDDSERTTWFRVSLWGKFAETMSQYLRKGVAVYVEGRLSVSAYMDKNNAPAARMEIRADKLLMLGGGAPETASEGTAQADSGSDDDEYLGEDLPF